MFVALLRRASVATLFASTTAASAQVTVSGPANGASCNPFSCRSPAGATTRYQQVYSARAFTGPISIGSIDFFRATPGMLANGALALYVSTTSAAVDALNTTNLDANLGDATALFGTYRLDGGQSPEVLTFTGMPYLYDPAAGNLLLDLRFNGMSAPIGGDAPYPIAFFRARSGLPGGNYSSALVPLGGGGGYGFDTRFNAAATSVPEPAVQVLAGTGLLLIAATGMRRRMGHG